MTNSRIIIIILVLVGLFTALFFITFEQKDVSTTNWSANYRYEFKDPFGTWMLQEILKISYGDEHVVALGKEDFYKINGSATNKGYLYIDNFLDFSKAKTDSLASFVSNGNSAMIITDSWSQAIDSLFPHIRANDEYIDSVTCLSITSSYEDFELRGYSHGFDSSIVAYHGFLNIDEDSIQYNYKITSKIAREHPISLQMNYGDGMFFIHSIPYLFTNVGLDQKDVRNYALKVLPLLDIDTLYIDHDHIDYYTNYDVSESRAERSQGITSKEEQAKQSPLQFIMATLPLKWAYYITCAGLLLFVISRGKRKQRVIPTLEQNENTSLEYINTVSDLYRTQNQHHKLAKQLKLIFHQWVRKKYFLQPGEPGYAKKISKKSRIPEEEVERLINRLKASQNNQRFDAIQLTNLHRDLEQFYKNSQ